MIKTEVALPLRGHFGNSRVVTMTVTGVAALTVSERGPSITQSRPTSDVTPSLAQLLTQPPARRSGGGGRFIVT